MPFLRAWERPQFIALAEKESGKDLAQFFKVWIYQDEKPALGSW
jgi:aminopeptidase N